MSIQIKRGMKKDLPQLKDGELAFCRDTKELYVGNNGNENVSVTKKIEDRLDAVDSQLEDKTNFVNIKEFGAKCDGVTDDTQAIISCLDYVINNKITKTILIPEGTTFLSGSIEKDCNGQSINIACVGDIKGTTENEIFYLYNFTNSNIQLNFKNGGNSSSYGLKVSKCSKSVLDIKGNGYKGTVLYVAGNKNQGMGVTSMLVDLNVTNACYRALQHGVDSDGAYQDAFGTYERILDFDSNRGMLFVNSSDITIQHIENHFIGNDYSVKFKNCGVVHSGVIAIGGKCSTLLELEKSSVTIDKLYTCNEEYGEESDDLVGVVMKNGSILNVLYYDLGMTKTFLNKVDSPSLCIINTLKTNRNDCDYITSGTTNTLNNSGIFSYNSYQLENRTSNIYKLPQRFDNAIEFYSTDTNVKRAYMSCYNTEWELNQVIPGGGRNKMMFFRATESSPFLNIPKLDVTGTLLLNSKQIRPAGSIGTISNPVNATTEEISNRLNLLITYLKDAGLMSK